MSARNLLQPNLELVISQFYAAGLEETASMTATYDDTNGVKVVVSGVR